MFIEEDDTNLFVNVNEKRRSMMGPQMTSMLEKKRIKELEDIIIAQRNFIAQITGKMEADVEDE